MPHLNVFYVLAVLAALLLAWPASGDAQGWYLLAPPVVRDAPVVDETAPLARWRPSPLYESARECEEIRLKWVASLQRSEGSVRRARAVNARCIAATDPRLASQGPWASAQAGWYLLIPPLSSEAVEAPPPLAQWSHSRSFDTETECEAARRDPEPGAGKVPGDPAPGRCISIGDRRLASGAGHDPAP